MAVLLHIDTATEHASVCLSNNEQVIALQESADQKNHASFIQPAIQQILVTTGYTLQQLDAIAVSNGPGSYTGLRVGLSTAKGLCYVINKPLILINTLEIMAAASIKRTKQNSFTAEPLYCPLIDARRMEVFMALFNNQLHSIKLPQALVLDETSFADVIEKQPVVFSGSGRKKLSNILQHENAVYIDVQHNATNMIDIAWQQFAAKKFSDVAYSDPFYLKEFFTIAPRN